MPLALTAAAAGLGLPLARHSASPSRSTVSQPVASLSSNGWTTGATVAPSVIVRGTTVTFDVTVKSKRSRSALVDMEVYSASQGRTYYRVWDKQSFTAGKTRTFSTSWTVPSSEALDAHVVKVGIFSSGWGTLYHWNDSAATFAVSSATTTVASTTTTAATTTAVATTTTTAAASTTTAAPTTTTAASTTTTAASTTTTVASSGLPALPAAWPGTLQLGSADAPGGAAALKAKASFGFRYQYLAGGVNTGSGWATWNPDGSFVTNYVQESRQAGIIPVFSYYQIYQSSPGVSMGEPNGIYTNLTTASTMAAYYNDLKLFFQRAAAAGGTTVLQVEPDLWAYMQQHATSDNATTVPVKVGGSGQADVAGLADNAAGFAQAIVRLRNLYGPNVIVGYHYSTWGTGNDFIYSDPSDATVDGLGVRTANFYKSLGARFDIAFTDLSDRDAAFKQYVYGDGGASWYTADDYRRSTVFLGAFTRTAGLRTVVWQIPVGNTKMLAENNTWNHYQDNKVEWLLDDTSRAHLSAYENAGAVAFLFGRGADGPTCSCDANGDGVTNPSAINGNGRTSLNSDDDGGYFGERSQLYYQQGAMTLP